MIEPLQKTPIVKSVMISEPIIEMLITDFGLDAEVAADRFYTSKTFAQLSNENMFFYAKPWQEIYELLKQELKMK
jgi:hypothetical protein